MQSYRVEKVVGEGSFGKALLCSRKVDAKKCIIKQIALAKMSRKEALQTEQEARLLARFNHPNIVAFWESFQESIQGKPILCIVMEFADGGDLSNLIQSRKNRFMPENQVVNITVQIALALKHVHDRKILHRDLKSQNIFLTSKGIVKLGDFGIAKVLRNTGELASTQIGTPYFMSPEILMGKRYNNKTDIWSLGCVVFELLTLKVPFQGTSMKQLVSNIINLPVPNLPSIYSLELKSLTKLMLAKNFKERPSINTILGDSLFRGMIGMLLTDQVRKKEFSHTVLHGDDILQTPRPPPIISDNSPPVSVVSKPNERVSEPMERPVKPDLQAKKKVDEQMERLRILREAHQRDNANLRAEENRRRELFEQRRKENEAIRKSNDDRISAMRVESKGSVLNRKQQKPPIPRQEQLHQRNSPQLNGMKNPPLKVEGRILSRPPPPKQSPTPQVKQTPLVVEQPKQQQPSPQPQPPPPQQNQQQQQFQSRQDAQERRKRYEQLKQKNPPSQDIEPTAGVKVEVDAKPKANWLSDLQLQMNALKNQINDLQSPSLKKDHRSPDVILQSSPSPSPSPPPSFSPPPPPLPVPSHNSKQSPQSFEVQKTLKEPQKKKISASKKPEKKSPPPPLPPAPSSLSSPGEDPLLSRRIKREQERKNFQHFLKAQRQAQVSHETCEIVTGPSTPIELPKEGNELSNKDKDKDNGNAHLSASKHNLNDDFLLEAADSNMDPAKDLRLRRDREREDLRKMIAQKRKEKNQRSKHKSFESDESSPNPFDSNENPAVISDPINDIQQHNEEERVEVGDEVNEINSLMQSSFFKFSQEDIQVIRKTIGPNPQTSVGSSSDIPLGSQILSPNEDNNLIPQSEETEVGNVSILETEILQPIEDSLSLLNDNVSCVDNDRIEHNWDGNQITIDSHNESDSESEDLEYDNLIQMMKNVMENSNQGDDFEEFEEDEEDEIHLTGIEEDMNSSFQLKEVLDLDMPSNIDPTANYSLLAIHENKSGAGGDEGSGEGEGDGEIIDDENDNEENVDRESIDSWDEYADNETPNHGLTVFGLPFPLGKTICDEKGVNLELSTPSSRMEALREYLENSLGIDRFIKVYRLLKSVGPKDDDDELLGAIESVVGVEGLCYMDTFFQLIHIEDKFESGEW